MKCTDKIYHRPYYPIMRAGEEGKPYICRLIPKKDGFEGEYLYDRNLPCRISYTVNGENTAETAPAGNGFSVSGLPEGAEVTVTVRSENGEVGRTRKVRTGALPDGASVINYLHPEDDTYIPSGQYLASPEIVRLPGGALIASMDTHMWYGTENLVILCRSDDNGKTFHYVTDLIQFFWSTLFVHKGVLYLLGVSSMFGNLQISASYDEGVTWTNPVTLLYGGRAYSYGGGIHKGPMQIVRHNGRLYTTCEYASHMEDKDFSRMASFFPGVISIDENADLLCPENWKCTGFAPYEGTWRKASEKTAEENFEQAGTGKLAAQTPGRGDGIEGNIVIAPDGKMYNYLRWKVGEVCVFSIDENDPEAPLTFEKIIPMPVSDSLFRLIRYNGKYYLVTNRKTDVSGKLYHGGFRNVLSIFTSTDLTHWELCRDVVNREREDTKETGFQYPCVWAEDSGFFIAVRSALNHAANFHDSNHILLWHIDKEDL